MIVHEEPGLSGLELWRGISRGATLYQLRDHKSEYFQALREFLVRLYFGDAIADDERESEDLRRAAGFVRAILCGGEALHPALQSTLCAAALPFAIKFDTGGAYAAKPGALDLFQSMKWRHGVALDLGQCRLKVMTAAQNCCLSRDESLLPFGAHAIDSPTGRARLRSFLQEGLARAAGPVDGIVLALPVALDGEGVAQPATYPGLFGPVEPIFSDLFDCPWVVLNDAVLAALGFRPEGREKTLVVTLGFGIGGALWHAGQSTR